MAFLETKHTSAALNKIKKELFNFLTVIVISSTVFFAFYYIYLIITNIEFIFHTVAYIILFCTVIITFIADIVYKKQKKDSRKEVRIKVEKKRILFVFVKLFKYLAKGLTVGLALYSSLVNYSFDLSFIFTLISCAIFLISLLAEFVIFYAIKYIDYISIGFELDCKSSWLAKLIWKDEMKAKSLESEIYELLGQSMYTKQEQKIIEYLVAEGDRLKKEKEEYYENVIKSRKTEKKQLKREKLSESQLARINKKYELSITEAKEMMNNPEKIENLINKAEKLNLKIINNDKLTNYISNFISLIKNYMSGKYLSISIDIIFSILGAIIYFVAPFDVIPDSLSHKGYSDELHVINKCLEMFGNEFDKFIEWKELQK